MLHGGISASEDRETVPGQQRAAVQCLRREFRGLAAMNQTNDQNRVYIFDTTLRDGEQSPGASMNLDEKRRIAVALEEMGVDIIEAGFPIASNGDFEAVREIARLVKTSSVAGLARAARRDIDRAWEALQGAARPRIHTF